jgi:hypothetical protein
MKRKKIAPSRPTDIVHAAAPFPARDLSPADVTTFAEGIARSESPLIRKGAEFIARTTLIVGTVGIAVSVAPARDESLRFPATNATCGRGLEIRQGFILPQLQSHALFSLGLVCPESRFGQWSSWRLPCTVSGTIGCCVGSLEVTNCS